MYFKDVYKLEIRTATLKNRKNILTVRNGRKIRQKAMFGEFGIKTKFKTMRLIKEMHNYNLRRHNSDMEIIRNIQYKII